MDALKIRAVLGLDKKDYDEGLKDAEDRAGSSGSKIGSFLTGTAKAVGAGLAAATAATGALVKSSVDAYGEYEQLAGGIETLFGESANVVMENARKAYKTAGKDANDYMNTVVGMAGALNKATGDVEKSAELADMAIVDMSDNVNKMGTSMEMVQNAYTGFSRGNFTMLDNLALGFSGTKEGMQELLDSAQAISGVQYDISSYADIVEAIHVVQTEMGITGTTSKEAATTIQGSINMTVEAWQNLVTGLTNPDADISQLIDDLVESAKAAASNLIPAISQSLKGIGKLVQGLAPIISKELPGLVKELLPMLLDAGITLFNGLIDALPDLMQVIFDQLPMIMNALIDGVIALLPMIVKLGLQFIMALAQGLLDALPQLIPTITQVIIEIVNMLTQPDTLTQLVMAAIQIMGAIAMGLIQALPVLIEALPQIIENVITTLLTLGPQIRLASVELFLNLVEGLIQVIPRILAQIPVIIMGIGNAFARARSQLIRNGIKIVSDIYDGFKSKINDAKRWGKDLIQNFIDGLLAKWNDLKNTVTGIAQSIKDVLGFSEPKTGPLSNFHTYAPDMMDLFIQGVNDNRSKLLDTITDTFDFQDLISTPTLNLGTENGNIGYNINENTNNEINKLLEQIANKQTNVTVVLEGDAQRLFRVIQTESRRNNELTGRPSFS